ncbi:alpha-beta hydrolase superfamily lysophospholipase [Micromonospora pisi]|uniref:Alpha-beta hydrolase superfamily lysophospholipase n=1 Tax=Micromonospora pisi TaxID=589240 RepID=A0A495JKY9_9ACTN|nr:alpha/beta fold hydrolase [Micromonospora pisi]RKR89573.1 alpha-beta hydrolase superfamily lysophospholipase [Micromonospora pisi]
MNTLDLESEDGLRLEAAVHPAVGPARLGAVVVAHDIGLDMDQGGMFMRLAERLTDVGFDVVRFSFRGHGGSEGAERDVTLEGTSLDLQAAIEAAMAHYSGPISIVAAGFGAAPVGVLLPQLDPRLHGLVLWNPMLDLLHTFVEPRQAWGLNNFGPEALRRLERDDFILVDGEFEFGRALFEEMSVHEPTRWFVQSSVPSLVVQSERDAWVAHDAVRSIAASRPACEFHSVHGSDHGFESRPHEDEVLTVTARWLTTLHSAPGGIPSAPV